MIRRWHMSPRQQLDAGMTLGYAWLAHPNPPMDISAWEFEADRSGRVARETIVGTGRIPGPMYSVEGRWGGRLVLLEGRVHSSRLG